MAGLWLALRKKPDAPTGEGMGEPLEPIPIFAPDATYDTKLKVLNAGPTVLIRFGFGPPRFSISHRLLLYHSPNITQAVITEEPSKTILLQEKDETPFSELHHFLTTGHLGYQVESLTGHDLRQDLTQACTMLLRVYHLCTTLGVEGEFRSRVKHELQRATRLAKRKEIHTPISGDIIMETYNATLDKGESTSDIWEFVVHELSSAFLRPPILDWDEYASCFSIPVFNKRVIIRMHKAIIDLRQGQYVDGQDVLAGEDLAFTSPSVQDVTGLVLEPNRRAEWEDVDIKEENTAEVDNSPILSTPHDEVNHQHHAIEEFLEDNADTASKPASSPPPPHQPRSGYDTAIRESVLVGGGDHMRAETDHVEGHHRENDGKRKRIHETMIGDSDIRTHDNLHASKKAKHGLEGLNSDQMKSEDFTDEVLSGIEDESLYGTGDGSLGVSTPT